MHTFSFSVSKLTIFTIDSNVASIACACIAILSIMTFPVNTWITCTLVYI